MKKGLLSLLGILILTGFSLGVAAQAPAGGKSPAAKAAAAPKVGKAYVCEMGCEVSDKPGKCSKCGMTLKEVNKADISYECEKDHTKSDKAGKCPKCGAEMKMQVKGADKTATQTAPAGHEHKH